MVDVTVLPSFLAAVLVITVALVRTMPTSPRWPSTEAPAPGFCRRSAWHSGWSCTSPSRPWGWPCCWLRPVALTIVRPGAVYLGWLAVTTLRSATRSGSAPPSTDGRRLLARAVLTNVTNPKVILFFAAFLPQFVRPGHGPTAVQMLTLGLLFLVVGLVIDSVVGLLAGRLRDVLSPGSRAAAALGVMAGLTFGTLAAVLALEALGT